MIGIFDSGQGGLTVLREVRAVLPDADIVYFGDIKNAPYGTKTNQELSLLTVKALSFLRAEGAERIVSACNSVSTSLAVSLFDALDLAHEEVIEMVGPTVSNFKNTSERVLLVATPATIDSGLYQSAFTMIGKEITALPLQELAGAIEAGRSSEDIEQIIRVGLSGIDMSHYDVLVLACTHYPLVQDIFARVTPLPLFDPARAVALRAHSRFWPREMGDGALRFVISQDSEPFRARVAELFPEGGYTIEVIE